MPKIPKTGRIVKTPEAGFTDTGLRSAPIDLTSAPSRALQQAGQGISDIGNLIAQTVEKQNAQDRYIAREKVELDMQNRLQPTIESINNSKGEETLHLFAQLKKEIENLPKYDDQNLPDTLGYSAERIKDIGWKQNDIELINIGRGKYLNKVMSAMSKKVAVERWNFQKELGKQKVAGLEQQLLSSQISLDDMPDGTEGALTVMENFYKSLGKPDAVIQPIIRRDTETLTRAFLDGGLERGDLGVINDITKGSFNDELTTPELRTFYKKKAGEARVRLAVDAYTVENYGGDEAKALKALNRDTKLGLSDIQKRKAGHSISYDASLLENEAKITQNTEWQVEADKLYDRFRAGKLTHNDISKSALPSVAGKGIDAQYSKKFFDDLLEKRQKKIESPTAKTFRNLYFEIVENPETFDVNDINDAVRAGNLKVTGQVNEAEKLRTLYKNMTKGNNPNYTRQMSYVSKEIKEMIDNDTLEGQQQELEVLDIMDDFLRHNPDKDPNDYLKILLQPFKKEKVVGFIEGLFTTKKRGQKKEVEELDIVKRARELKYTPENLEFTAKQNNMTIEELKRKLNIP